MDVFFVISGFLMTGIIAEEFSRRGAFSFGAFYARRVRRIFPALLAMIAVTTALGYFLLLPGDYKEFAESGAYAALSLGNVFFYFSTGYFDSPAEAKGLLHTWSLGVEEQFYLVWPLVMIGLFRCAKGRRETMLWLLLGIVGAGFMVSVYGVMSNQKAAFYLLHARIWELAAGGALVFVQRTGRQWLDHSLPAFGLALILWSVFALTPENPFPGWNALPAVLGAALIVNPASASSIVARALSVAPLAFVGQISYSLYLWHWPLIVFWRQYRSGASLTAYDLAMLGAGMLLAAWLSWRWIEEPFRRPARIRVALPLGLTAAAGVAALAMVVVERNGFPERISPTVAALSSLATMWEWDCPYRPGLPGVTCSVGADWQTATSRGVVWGDSHAEHLLPLFDVAGRKTGRAVALFGDCPVIYYEGGLKRAVAGFANYDLGCAEKRARYLDLLKSSPELEFIFVAARWSAYLGDTYRSDGEPRSVAHGLKLLREGVEEFIGEMAPLHRKIILLGEMPQLGFDPIPCVMLERIYAEDLNLLRYAGERDRCHAATAAISRSSFEARQSATNAVLQSVAAGHPDVLAFFPTDAMCRPDCVTSVSGEFLFRDGNHLRRNLSAAALDQFVLLLRLPELFARLGDGPAPRAMRKNN